MDPVMDPARAALLAALDVERFTPVPQAPAGSCADGPSAHLMRVEALARANAESAERDALAERARFKRRAELRAGNPVRAHVRAS